MIIEEQFGRKILEVEEVFKMDYDDVINKFYRKCNHEIDKEFDGE